MVREFREWGMGHGALGMGHWALGMGEIITPNSCTDAINRVSLNSCTDAINRVSPNSPL
ncbi:hypothetical protein [Nostoc sp.]|uniref:hypothetical protein n=1 Tax=Nostoc sp. TaxID=1180 RepID=UPI002FFB952A